MMGKPAGTAKSIRVHRLRRPHSISKLMHEIQTTKEVGIRRIEVEEKEITIAGGVELRTEQELQRQYRKKEPTFELWKHNESVGKSKLWS